jgi:hypothetical protein
MRGPRLPARDLRSRRPRLGGGRRARRARPAPTQAAFCSPRRVRRDSLAPAPRLACNHPTRFRVHHCCAWSRFLRSCRVCGSEPANKQRILSPRSMSLFTRSGTCKTAVCPIIASSSAVVRFVSTTSSAAALQGVRPRIKKLACAKEMLLIRTFLGKSRGNTLLILMGHQISDA